MCVEYERTLENAPYYMAVEWLPWDRVMSQAPDRSMHPFQWVFNVRNAYEIVVVFPTEYPFKAPYYYIRTFGDVLMSIKEYMHRIIETSQEQYAIDHVVRYWPLLPVNGQWDPRKDAWIVVDQIADDPYVQQILSDAKICCLSINEWS